ncbi:MAG: hypothetical protein ABFR63_06775 [Thermodesulfobacteriota bacterium]
MKNFFARISLKTVFSLFTGLTICLLFIVILFAGKQYLLYRHCEHLIDASQHLLFQFTGMKEHINETLLSDAPLNSRELIQEIRGMDDELSLILDDILIPEEFKLSFVSQVDLVNVTVTLRNLQNNKGTPSTKQLNALSGQLRDIQSKLNGFHQLISRYTQTQLLGLYRALVGLFGMVICFVSIMLLIINKYITSPVLHYCRALFPEKRDPVSMFTLHKTIETLGQQASPASGPTRAEASPELSRLYRYSSIGHLLGGVSHELNNLSNGVINYTQAITDLSDELRLDDDAKQLLEKLFTEEKKMSALLSHMIQFTDGSDSGVARRLSLETLFSQITVLVRGTLQRDNISLSVNLSDPTLELDNHVSDLQLVVLSALQSSRASLNEKFRNRPTTPGEKKIEVSFDQEAFSDDRVVLNVWDNGAPKEMTAAAQMGQASKPWHTMNFCRDFLKTFGGSLQIERQENRSNLCTISTPRH